MHQKLLEIINDSNPKFNIYENLVEYVVEVAFNNIFEINETFCYSIIEYFNHGDDFSLQIYSEYSDKAILRCKTDINSFLNKLNNEIIPNKDSDENYILKLVLSKNETNKTINIYNIDMFVEYMETLSLLEQFRMFDKIRCKNIYQFKLIYSDDELISKTFSLTNKSQNQIHNILEREEILNKRNLNNSFVAGDKLSFIPDDFSVIKESNCIKLNYIFRRLQLISSLIFISNASVFDNPDIISFRIVGYKPLNVTINKNTNINDDVVRQLYDIYSWIYSSKNISDKIGLTRNILSLGLSEDLKMISYNLFESINSAHEIYLRENIKEYLEVKNKVSEFIFDMTQKSSQIVDELSKSFLNNMIAAVTYIFTLVIMNALSDKKFDNIFTKDITLISIGALIISYIYMIISLKNLVKETDRFKVLYNRLRTSYDEVLNEDDINIIFKKDLYLNEDLEFIETKGTCYRKMWRNCLIVMFVIIILGGNCHIINEVKYIISLFN